MSTGFDLTLLDGAILSVLLVAVARGIWMGLIRESFSVAALGAAVVTTRLGTPPAADWLVATTGGEIGPAAAPWLMGAAIAAATVAAVSVLGRFIKRGAQFAGLGFADRIGGAAIGAAEGVLVGLVIVLGATLVVGRDHPVIAESKSLEAYDVVRAFVDEHADDLPDVAGPRGEWY
jgi:uncharacterized membrane protein required for colicin V production